MSSRLQDDDFIGALRGTRKVSGLTLAETEYAARLHVPSHAHDHALCCLVLDGGFTEIRGRRKESLEPGSVLFHPENEPHAHDFAPQGGRCFTVVFGAGWVDRMASLDLRPPDAPTSLHRTKAGWLAGQLYHEFRVADSASVLSIEGLTLALLGEIARKGTSGERRGPKPGWLLRAVDYLHTHYTETVSLTELAQRVEIDPSHLARTFREFYDCTMSEYVRRLRVEKAKQDILDTDSSLAEIALDAGFADQAHFSRVFKQLTGVTPGDFRRAATRR